MVKGAVNTKDDEKMYLEQVLCELATCMRILEMFNLHEDVQGFSKEVSGAIYERIDNVVLEFGEGGTLDEAAGAAAACVTALSMVVMAGDNENRDVFTVMEPAMQLTDHVNRLLAGANVARSLIAGDEVEASVDEPAKKVLDGVLESSKKVVDATNMFKLATDALCDMNDVMPSLGCMFTKGAFYKDVMPAVYGICPPALHNSVNEQTLVLTSLNPHKGRHTNEARYANAVWLCVRSLRALDLMREGIFMLRIVDEAAAIAAEEVIVLYRKRWLEACSELMCRALMLVLGTDVDSVVETLVWHYQIDDVDDIVVLRELVQTAL